ncbi:MAG: hypothetical protein AAGJ08_25480 [Cyanobacteria bacterium P01_H01_bin.35]
MKKIKKGQIIDLSYKGRDFEAIVIDPNGMGNGQPTVGFGFGMMQRYSGLPDSTMNGWLQGLPEDDFECLKVPSGNTYRVSRITGLDKNEYVVLEVRDWFDLAFDVLEKPGRVSKPIKTKLLQFVKWFAIKGFYAGAYAVLKGAYTAKDDRTLSGWMEIRLAGVIKRNKYTDFLQSQGCEGYDYAYWTDCVYTGLFNMQARQMKQMWKLIEGDKSIGRNYIPEAEGLKAVAYCENQVVELFVESLEQAHEDAISFTRRKFKLN